MTTKQAGWLRFGLLVNVKKITTSKPFLAAKKHLLLLVAVAVGKHR